jgi:creatinine amidohydrolase/Fe(II)-dependent formamide hydrolase-like protein/ketosteroid isomerase-like protein
VIVPGGILEEHGPYLPAGSDGIFNQRLANDLAAFVASQPGWTALMLPSVPLGAGTANEIGAKYSFPGSCSVLPATLRSVFMDLADQLGRQKFRWIIVVHGHGDPVHNQMLDQASDYFHDTYGGEMVNLFGYIWAANKDFRTPEEQKKDGQAEHATMTETSVILALKPEWVAPDYKTAKPYAGANIEELEKIAKAQDWPGYFGDPALATASLGTKIYQQWLTQAKELVSQVLAGKDYRKLPRYGDLYAGDPADAAAARQNAALEQQHLTWVAKQHDSAIDEQTIMELERQWAKAEETYDPKTLDRILAAEFVSMDENGQIRNKAQEIASDGEWKPPGPEVVDDMSVHLNGDTAICLGRFTWTDRNSGSVRLQGHFVDTFLRRDGEWQVVAKSYIRADGQAH